MRRDLQLMRVSGNPLDVRTLDLGPGGARVASTRPLRVDEELRFDLDLSDGAPHVGGRARVVREQEYQVYALRFEQLAPADSERLWALAGAWRT